MEPQPLPPTPDEEKIKHKVAEDIKASDTKVAVTAPPVSDSILRFIAENGMLLNRKTKITILGIVEREIGDAAIYTSRGKKGVDINLDACNQLNPEVITMIHQIVKAAIDTLSRPAGQAAETPVKTPAPTKATPAKITPAKRLASSRITPAPATRKPAAGKTKTVPTVKTASKSARVV